MKSSKIISAICISTLFMTGTVYSIILTGPGCRQAHRQQAEQAYQKGRMDGQSMEGNYADDANVQIQSIESIEAVEVQAEPATPEMVVQEFPEVEAEDQQLIAMQENMPTEESVALAVEPSLPAAQNQSIEAADAQVAVPVLMTVEDTTQVVAQPQPIEIAPQQPQEIIKIVKVYPVYEAVAAAAQSIKTTAQELYNSLYEFVANKMKKA